MAVNRNYAAADGERKTDFFNCVAWRGLGETIAKYTAKGKKVAVTGSIELRDYEDDQAIKRTAIDIVVQDCEFLSPKESNEEAPQAKKPTLKEVDDDSDIPF